jgi:hypothetical protein
MIRTGQIESCQGREGQGTAASTSELQDKAVVWHHGSWSCSAAADERQREIGCAGWLEGWLDVLTTWSAR